MSPFAMGENYVPTFCPVFQGIHLVTPSGEKLVYGWESFMRGPENTPIESPLALFRNARLKGRLPEIDLLAFTLSCQCFVANDPGGKLFINLFPETISSENFNMANLLLFLQKIDLPPERLVIEIIEGRYDIALIEGAIRECRQEGVSFALDDFGAGHQDFSRWINLQPAYVKCDRSLIQRVCQSKRQLNVLRSLERLCETDNSVLLAEGIETQAEFDCIIKNTNIRLTQGYFFDRPKPLDQSSGLQKQTCSM